jgi:hypothetical protein
MGGGNWDFRISPDDPVQFFDFPVSRSERAADAATAYCNVILIRLPDK